MFLPAGVNRSLWNRHDEAHGAYAGIDVTPKIETSDNAFKIILADLNANMRQEKSSEEKSNGGVQKGAVIVLAKGQRFFTGKEVEKALGPSQTTCEQMMEREKIIQKGKDRNTHYCLSGWGSSNVN